MKCPVCQTENENKHQTPVPYYVDKNKSWSLSKEEDYYVCKNCGVMYQEVKP